MEFGLRSICLNLKNNNIVLITKLPKIGGQGKKIPINFRSLCHLNQIIKKPPLPNNNGQKSKLKKNFIYLKRSYWEERQPLSGRPTKPPVVAFRGISCPAFMVYDYHRVGFCGGWTRHDCTTVDPYGSDNQIMQFTNMVEFQGKVYALSLEGTLAVVENISEQLTIKSISKCRAIPSVKAKYFKEHLLELNRDILLVFLLYRKSFSVVDKAEVFRLEFHTLEWIKVDNLGGRAVFLEKESCVCVRSVKIGCKADCVYFTLERGDKW